jgi:hypothetical protein
MIYTGNRSFNRKSFEPEIEHWLKGTSPEIDCVHDAIDTSPGSMFVPIEDSDMDPRLCIIDQSVIDDGWEESFGSYAYGNDDLETMSIRTAEEMESLAHI